MPEKIGVLIDDSTLDRPMLGIITEGRFYCIEDDSHFHSPLGWQHLPDRKWREAVGCAPGFLGGELPEDVIRRSRER